MNFKWGGVIMLNFCEKRKRPFQLKERFRLVDNELMGI